MFTNWLTDTTGLINSRNSTGNASTTRLPETNNHVAVASTKTPSEISAGLYLLSGHNNLTNLSSNIMSTPPDIMLEVGPAPTTARFMAHGIVLGMHSGYLRSAIRLDERGGGGGGGIGVGAGVAGSNVGEAIVYLTNVTAEQFAPLLTYMYTGYLDLNVENIFGVLLATHVLHMPRALEICRSYLARAQSEGYFGANNTGLTTTATNPHGNIPAPTTNGKIIRPIASKPQLTNFGFMPISHQSLALNPAAANANITTTTISVPAVTVTETKSNNSLENLNKTEEDDDDIDVDDVDKQSTNNENQIPQNIDDEDEDVEVFIDSNSEADVVVETQIQKLSFRRKFLENQKSQNERGDSKTKIQQQHPRKSSHHSKSERRRKGSSGLQVAKAPIPASQLDCSEANKVIIDVASCDGPVRFKRILNTAYGHKPDASSSAANNHGSHTGPVLPERSLQSVSLSFHQQMAKTISQQQRQLNQTEESENSETSNGSMGASLRASERNSSANRKTQNELFVCIYCKHTFKSQYCYQKHAKRHLNPLTLQATCVPQGKTNAKEEPALSNELQITKHQNPNPTTTRSFYGRNAAHFLATSSAVATENNNNNNSTNSSDYLRREVRPLDMNVQYYPCKTCGCKFPSYYFVHKHRKMCHAEEEAQQQNNNENNTNNAPTAATVNADECLNTQISD